VASYKKDDLCQGRTAKTCGEPCSYTKIQVKSAVPGVIKHGVPTGERLKRAAQPSAIASEGAGGQGWR
jgi:hypothetical protein